MTEHYNNNAILSKITGWIDGFSRTFRHPQSQHNIWGGTGRETFGDDLELVKSLPVESVWTVVDGGDTVDQWILTGIHTVNRICYLVTEVPHYWKDIQFRIPARGYALTQPRPDYSRILLRPRLFLCPQCLSRQLAEPATMIIDTIIDTMRINIFPNYLFYK